MLDAATIVELQSRAGNQAVLALLARPAVKEEKVGWFRALWRWIVRKRTSPGASPGGRGLPVYRRAEPGRR